MTLLEEVLQINQVNRITDLERIESPQPIKGDFEGSVTGRWVRLDLNGSGIVSYNNKMYATKPLGFTSIAEGTAVEMSHANGVYYSKW